MSFWIAILLIPLVLAAVCIGLSVVALIVLELIGIRQDNKYRRDKIKDKKHDKV